MPGVGGDRAACQFVRFMPKGHENRLFDVVFLSQFQRQVSGIVARIDNLDADQLLIAGALQISGDQRTRYAQLIGDFQLRQIVFVIHIGDLHQGRQLVCWQIGHNGLAIFLLTVSRIYSANAALALSKSPGASGLMLQSRFQQVGL